MRLLNWMFTALLPGAIGAAFAQTPTTSPPASATATEVNEAGVIDLVEGQVNVLDTNRKRRTVKVGDKLFSGIR